MTFSVTVPQYFFRFNEITLVKSDSVQFGNILQCCQHLHAIPAGNFNHDGLLRVMD